MARKYDLEPVCCGVCMRQATGLGYAPKQGKPIMWLCQNTTCISLGQTVFHMNPKTFTAHELFSLDDAGEAGGAYLESIGKFNLAELSADQWTTFLKTVLTNYGDKMRERLLSHAAPF